MLCTGMVGGGSGFRAGWLAWRIQGTGTTTTPPISLSLSPVCRAGRQGVQPASRFRARQMDLVAHKAVFWAEVPTAVFVFRCVRPRHPVHSETALFDAPL